MINTSLRDIREVIKMILVEKNKKSIDVSPEFVESCLTNYCHNDECFALSKVDQNISSDIFETIKNEMKRDSLNDLSDLLVSVFCVVNASRSSNNPPLVPYIDVNDIWYEMNHSMSDMYKANSRFFTSCISLLQKMTNMKDKVKDLLGSDGFKDFTGVLKKIRDKSDINDEDVVKITKFLKMVDKSNAASVIGTLQFVDSLSKYNTTNMMCSNNNVKNFNNLGPFKDIIKDTRIV
jgi:hypothetical protein